jgi:hypothetical protein
MFKLTTRLLVKSNRSFWFPLALMPSLIVVYFVTTDDKPVHGHTWNDVGDQPTSASL